MNPKLFSLLLLLPVAVFATDRLISKDAPDGGGKESKKTETKTAQPTPLQESTAPIETVQDEKVQSTSASSSTENQESAPQFSSLTEADLIKDYTPDVKTGLEKLDEAYELQQETDEMVWLGSDLVDKNVSAWLDKTVSQRLKAVNPLKINLENSFSRCPSGYHVVLASHDGKLLHDGWLVGDEGCHDSRLGHFEFDYATRTVQVHVGADGEFLPLALYLKYCKAALS